MKAPLIFIATSLCLTSTVMAEPFISEVKICHVRDGDTADACEPFRDKYTGIRIFGVDAPEKSQEHGPAATEALKNMILGQVVTLRCNGEKTWNRHVCKIYRGGVDVGGLLVESGWAFDNPKYSHGEYADRQSEAIQKGAGMFGSLVTPERHRRGR